ncbi:MAG: dTDP-4-dehydrorhamnose reductase [Bacillota bacterium]
MLRVLISGGAGMLALALRKSFAHSNVLALTREQMDITKPEDTLKAACDFKPDLILNPAALTRVDDCELDSEKSFLVNALGAANMAVAARETGGRLVHFSTDYVFDGCRKTPYREEDKPNPLSIYGQSKLSGENFVRKICIQHYIIRTSWLFGESDRNFVNYIWQKLQKKETVQAAVDQVGSPTFTLDLAEAVNLLVKKPLYGTYHLTNSGFCSRYQLAQELARYANCPERLVIPIKMGDLNLPAGRPLYTVLDNACWREKGFYPLRHYSGALKDYLVGGGLCAAP